MSEAVRSVATSGPEALPVPPKALRDDDETLRRKLFWIVVLRSLIITTLFGALVLVQVITTEFQPLGPLYYLLGSVYPLTLVYIFAYRRLGNPAAQAYTQTIGDMLLVTGLVYFSGGLLSPFYFLYIIPIITASITLYRNGSLIVASLSGILYGGMVDLMYYGIIPFYGETRRLAADVSTGVVYYNIFSALFGFFATSLLSSYLSETLKRTGAQLEVKLADLAELQHIHMEIVENMASGLLSTDLHGQITTVNPAGCRILASEQREIIGRRLADFFQVEPGFLTALNRNLIERRVARYELDASSGSGGRLIVGLSASHLVSREGTPNGFVFNFQDLTDVRRLEQEVRIKDRLATLGEMAAGIAHEIRNPLASISGSVQVLREELALTHEQEYLMDIVMRETARLDKTLEEFLDYARPRAVIMTSIDLVDIARETAALLMNSYELGPDHKVQIDSDRPAPFLGDHDQWAQVFWNLSKNAIKAMPFGGKLSIGIASQAPDGYRLTFRDEGVGMSESVAQRAGEPFFTAFQRGSGLGMAIVQRIVKDYDGRLTIRSREKEGTEIEIIVPGRIKTAAVEQAGGVPV